MNIMNNGFDLLFHDHDDENNNGLLFCHNFHDTNVKFYHSKNNYAYVDTIIIKYNFNIC
jgi:hypothetical protein